MPASLTLTVAEAVAAAEPPQVPLRAWICDWCSGVCDLAATDPALRWCPCMAHVLRVAPQAVVINESTADLARLAWCTPKS
jgi:hypothetical protein